MSADCVSGFLWENTQEPPLLEFAEEGVFNQAAQIIEVDDGQGRINWQTGQEDLSFLIRIDLVVKLSDDDGVDGAGAGNPHSL